MVLVLFSSISSCFSGKPTKMFCFGLDVKQTYQQSDWQKNKQICFNQMPLKNSYSMFLFRTFSCFALSHYTKMIRGSIQSTKWKFSFTAWLEFKGNVSALAETAFMVNAAYVGSIGNYLKMYIAESVTLYRLNRALGLWFWMASFSHCPGSIRKLLTKTPIATSTAVWHSRCVYQDQVGFSWPWLCSHSSCSNPISDSCYIVPVWTQVSIIYMGRIEYLCELVPSYSKKNGL
jgi:hypothetical protein